MSHVGYKNYWDCFFSSSKVARSGLEFTLFGEAFRQFYLNIITIIVLHAAYPGGILDRIGSGIFVSL
jgi:hypothetical protein